MHACKGLIAFALCSGHGCMQLLTLCLCLQRTLNVEFSVPQQLNISPEGRDLLRRILVRNPIERLTLQQVMQHSWFCSNLPAGVADMNARILSQADAVVHETWQVCDTCPSDCPCHGVTDCKLQSVQRPYT